MASSPLYFTFFWKLARLSATPSLVTESFLARFSGIARLYGREALARFQQSHVTIVGVGGVGCWVAEALARSGVGKLTLIDLDDLCVTNTNRQLHATSETIGQSKALVMAERLRTINPEIEVLVRQEFFYRRHRGEHSNRPRRLSGGRD